MASDESRSLQPTWRPGMPNVPDNHPWRLDPAIPRRVYDNKPFADAVPRKVERKRLDLRLSHEMQTQLNDLCSRLNVNATEAIRQGIAALHGQQFGAVAASAPDPKPLPQPKSIAARLAPKRDLREMDDLIEQTERELWGR